MVTISLKSEPEIISWTIQRSCISNGGLAVLLLCSRTLNLPSVASQGFTANTAIIFFSGSVIKHRSAPKIFKRRQQKKIKKPFHLFFVEMQYTAAIRAWTTLRCVVDNYYMLPYVHELMRCSWITYCNVFWPGATRAISYECSWAVTCRSAALWEILIGIYL